MFLWLAAGAGVLGQPAATNPQLSAAQPPATQPAAAGLPTIPYVDPTYGFQTQVPAGWKYDRARFEGPEGSIGLLRGWNADGSEALQILVFRRLDVEAPFERWLDTFDGQLAKLHPGTQIERRLYEEPRPPRAAFLVEPRGGATRTVTWYLCVSFDPHTVWVMARAAMIAQPAQQQAVQQQFEHIVRDTRVLYDPWQAEELRAAFERGLTMLRELHGGAKEVPLDQTERYYEITLAGKPIGYLLRWMRRDAQPPGRSVAGVNRKSGLRVHEESWRFADDGTVRFTELDLFTSDDFRSELIEHRSVQLPAPDVPTERLYIELDQCIREGKTLFSSFSTNLDAALPDPRPAIQLGPRYLDLAWVRLLPRLLARAPQEPHAFAIYDSATRAISIHIIRPLGATTLPGRGEAGLAFETRDGFVAQPSRIYADAQGVVARIETGELALVETPRDEIERRYAARREAARQRMTPSPPAPPLPRSPPPRP